MSEPKVEQWMRDAASELGNLDIDDFQREALTECDRDEDRAKALMLERLAGVIAKHAPMPGSDHFAGVSNMVEFQPIRRGDVVQVDPAAWEGRVRPRLWIVLDIDEHGYAKTGGSPDVPLSRCVRIGRARYYPDGTKVED